jgi:aminoglycoside 3-N-acetyltransferase
VEGEDPPLVTRSRLLRDLAALGVRPGDTIMLHASCKAIGWLVGGPILVLRALLDLLTPDGTLLMIASWEDDPYDLAEWPEERQRAYLAELPAYDPATSPADWREMGILTEYLRTWPGARRSAHPFSYVAVGARADWLTADHPLNYRDGAGSPLEKLCAAGGRVLLLGSPLANVTLLHHAEWRAAVPNKRIARYRLPILRGGERVWVEIEEFDTSLGIADWDGEDYFDAIVGEYIAAGRGRTGTVGAARSHLFDAADITDFAVAWMERHLGRA